jgi:peptidoglycan/LPS O-acetylase OafA/YrhL
MDTRAGGPDRAYFHVPVADGMRVLCVAIVALYHFWQQSWLNLSVWVGPVNLSLEPVVRSGYMAVDILLLLSGFVLFLPWARAGILGGAIPSTRAFYWKRALRTLPSYYLTVLILLFAFALPEGVYDTPTALWRDLLPHLTLTFTFFRASYHFSHLNAALWTLGIELQAYLLFPFLARAFTRRPLVCWVGMTMAAWAFRGWICWTKADLAMWINQLPAFLDVYALGMLAAWLYVRLTQRRVGRSWLWTLAACLVMIGIWKVWGTQTRVFSREAQLLMRGQAILRFPLVLLAAGWLVAASQAYKGFQAAFSGRLMSFLGGISFQYYIWHQFLAVRMREDWRIPPYRALEAPQMAGEQPWQWQYMLLCILLSGVVATLFTYLWEKPAARWVQKRRAIL